MRNLLAAIAGLTLLIALPLDGQSIVTGELEGIVADSLGGPIPGALVTLRRPGAGATREVTSSAEGRFSFPFLIPGIYDVIAEALGRRPVAVDQLPIRAGRTASLRLLLAPATPPVEVRDTLYRAGLPEAVGGGLDWLSPQAVAGLPPRTPDLASLISLHSGGDAAGGREGLPEALTALFVDGQPLYSARHPASVGDPARNLIVPRSSLEGVILPRTSDIEWGKGTVVALSTGVQRSGVPELSGIWGGDVGWSGSTVPGEVPAFASWWGSAATTFELVRDSAHVHLAFESGSLQQPIAPLFSDSVAGAIGTVADLLKQSTLAETSWSSGSLRLGWALSGGGTLQASLGASTFTHDLPGWLARSTRYPDPPSTSSGTDAFGTASLELPLAERFALELRAGGGISRRRFGAEVVTATSTLLLAPPVTVGGAAGEVGEVDRSDISATGALHLRVGPHRVKSGIRAGVANHRYDLFATAPATFLFGQATGLGGSGILADRPVAVPAITFSTSSAEVFAQYRWSPPGRGVTLTVGGLYGTAALPTSRIRPDDRWLELTALSNDSVPNRPTYAGGVVHGSWDPTGRNRTVLQAGLSLENGEIDPAALYELIQNNGLFPIRRISGSLPSWPTPPPSDAGTRSTGLTLLDPKVAPPRTQRAVLGLAHRFGDGTTLRVAGNFRRTERLLRRTDLNAPATSGLTGEGGRSVHAPLQAWSGVVGPADPNWRRFGEYDAVWALNADGWSRYREVTVGLDRKVGREGLLFASYTYSETTDNLFGLAAGDHWARLSPGIPRTEAIPWEEGTSDLDVPHRVSAGIAVPVPGSVIGLLSAVYRGRSGLPFSPMVRRGLDVNGDGSWTNDVAWIPETTDASVLLQEGGCDGAVIGSFPVRNSCRGAAVHEVDLRLTLGPLTWGRTELELTVDLLNATDQENGIRDDALLLVDPTASVSMSGSVVSIPYRLNPDFGAFSSLSDRGRQLRLGLRLRGPR